MSEAAIAIRVPKQNPDHHLWNNNGTWWCHLTFHHPNHTKERVRLSLETRDLLEARRVRDAIIRLFGGRVDAHAA